MTHQATSAALSDLLVGIQEAFPADGLENKLARNRPLRIKLGFDPTKPDLHLGHAVVLTGLRRFQEAGHQVVLIIGDFTARIGDPTGKKSARPPLSAEEIAVNARTYLDQLGLLIDLSKAEIHHNSDWLAKLTLEETIKLLGKATVAQMLARENFALRYERGDGIGLHEFLYPLLQGYDSLAIKADVELGGTDQRFNLLVGRDLQDAYNQEAQVCITYPILEGTDGKEKMSKSLDNSIGLTMDPTDMYGRTMSIPDSVMATWYRLASGLPDAEVIAVVAGIEAGILHPRDAKLRLARCIVTLYHGADAALAQEEAFIRRFSKKELAGDIPEAQGTSGNICQLLLEIKLVKTSSEARRMVEQGGVKVHRDGAVQHVDDIKYLVELPAEGLVIQVGKRRFAKVFPT